MKKMMGFVMVLILMLNIVSYAENITLYGDVHFGDDNLHEKVWELCDGDLGRMYIPLLWDFSSVFDDCSIASEGVTRIEISGISKSGAIFAVNKDKRIYQCLYTFGVFQPNGIEAFSNKNDADSIYNALTKKLEQKYGTPSAQYFKEEKAYVLYSFSEQMAVPFTNCVEMANASEKSVLQNLGCAQISEWLVKLDDGNAVLINCFVGYNETNLLSVERSYTPYILYTYIPADALTSEKTTNDWL